MNNISHKKEYRKEAKRVEKVQVTPRKRKSQRTLRNVNQFLDHLDTPQFSKKKNILKLRNEKEEENMKGQILNKIDQSKFSQNKNENNIYHEEEKIEVTPRKRKDQKIQEKVDQILDNVETPPFSKDILRPIRPIMASKTQNISKLRDEKTEDMIQGILDNVNTPQDFENKIISKLKYEVADIYLKQESEEEKVQVTPRRRKPQRTLEKIDQILDNADTPQFSKNQNILKFRYAKKNNRKM